MAVVLPESSPDFLLTEVERLLAIEDPYSEEFDGLQIGDWAEIHVYLKDADRSAISSPYMEAFLELQRQIYQLAALGITGEADIGRLTDADKIDLEISVTVTGGSSNLTTELKGPLERLASKLIGKMTRKQLTLVIVAIAAIVGTGWAWREWLEHTKAIQLEQLKSKEHLAALEKLSFVGQDNSKAMERLVAIIESQGQFGKRALEAIQATNDGLLRAITKEGRAKINGIEIDSHQAELLRVPTRRKADQVPVIRPVRVVSINTSDLLDLQLVLEDTEDKIEYKVRFKDNLFAGLDRHRLFESLENRKSFFAELAIRELDGQIRSVEFLRIAGAQ
jgi:hypothetical protein